MIAILAPAWLGWLVLAFLGIGHVGRRLREPGWLRHKLTGAALVLGAWYLGMAIGTVLAVGMAVVW